jgi:hypothetical protein
MHRRKVHTFMEGTVSVLLAIVIHAGGTRMHTTAMLHYTHVVATFLWVVHCKTEIPHIRLDTFSISCMCIVCDVLALLYVFAGHGDVQMTLLYAFMVSFAMCISAWGVWDLAHAPEAESTGSTGSTGSAATAATAATAETAVITRGVVMFDEFAQAAIRARVRPAGFPVGLRVRIPKLNFGLARG